MSHLLYPIGVAEVEHEEYDTGWINRSVWTNVHLGSDTTKNVDSDIDHNLNAPISDLDTQLWVSPNADGSGAYLIGTTNYAPAASKNQYDFSIVQTSQNSFTLQTGVQGLMYYDDSGAAVGIGAQDWYYRVKVAKRQPATRIVQNPAAIPYWHDNGEKWKPNFDFSVASKTTGWTANSYAGGLEIDFSPWVPRGTLAVKAVIALQWTSGGGTFYWRPADDPQISDDATGGVANRLATLTDAAQWATDQYELWLSEDLRAQIATSNVNADVVNVGVPISYYKVGV